MLTGKMGLHALSTQGIDAAVERYKALKSEQPDAYTFDEWQLKSLALNPENTNAIEMLEKLEKQ